MVEEANLSSVLSEFARTMVTDFPIQKIVDSLVERIVEILPITAAGVTLINESGPPRYIAASDESALRFEELQSAVAEGPCLSAYELGEAVAMPDLAHDRRFPRFRPAARDAGLAAVFAFPLRHSHGRLGALDLYRDTPGSLDGHDMDTAQTLADVAAAYLLNAESREEARATSAHFLHSSLHDALTGLPNRILLQERLAHATERAARSHRAAAVLFIDLDRFKHVNDSHGHHVGDELLVAVADRLAEVVRPGDTLSRVSGDEFVFLCEDLRSERDAELIAARVTRGFAEPFVLKAMTLIATASVGVAYAGPGQRISDQLIINADMAMYQAKRRGGDRYQVFDLREALDINQRNGLESDLHTAIADGVLAIAYQPIVRTSDGLITGVEALLRWTHPTHGQVSPIFAIAIAEQSGLINQIGRWVLQQSGDDRARWLHDTPAKPLDLSVNVSGHQLLADGFCETVETMLRSTGMDPACLILELTENIFIKDHDRSIIVLTALKALGVRLALDDFGTGFSSLSYLRRLPVDLVKIDQAFVSDIDEGPEGEVIFKAVVDLAHVLGLSVTAEGVETEAQRDRVSDLGCDASQGFYYAEPMPAAALGARLRGTSDLLPLPPSQKRASSDDRVAPAHLPPSPRHLTPEAPT